MSELTVLQSELMAKKFANSGVAEILIFFYDVICHFIVRLKSTTT